MRLREWLELRALAQDRYDAHSGEQYELRRLADTYGLDAVLDWLKAGFRLRLSTFRRSPTC